ncbi:hypothetical protein MN116_007302 [Schistosoma mekongi]|uniref:Transmembrane protein 209 n=1 Tax=Schistosoma mekongi TaxID=38744 RepID=A0AAE1ZAB8_SCHME|nr:hypothetical protein MN116_007302 [Schistosoma mekongi]
MFTQVWASPKIERQCKAEARIKVLNNAYKWLLVDILVGICVLLEFYIQPFFRLFSLPVGWIYAYEKLVLSFFTLLIACILYHTFVIKSSISIQKIDSDNYQNQAAVKFHSSPLNSSHVGPSMFCSSLLKDITDDNSCGATFGNSSYEVPSGSPSRSAVSYADVGISQSLGDTQSIRRQSGLSTVSPQYSHSHSNLSQTHCGSLRSPGSPVVQENLSLLDLALSPIVNSGLGPVLPTVGSGDAPIHGSGNMHRSVTWSSPFLTSGISPRYQYQAAYIQPTNPCHQYLNDSQKSLSGSPFIPNSITPDSGKSDREVSERFEDEYWVENQVGKSDLDRWTLNLRKWLHGTIIRRIVNEIDAINRSLEEAGRDKTLIGSTSLTTLQQLCSLKYQYLPTLPVLLAFLDFMKDQGYLVNRLRELARESSLQEFRWDSGSKSTEWPWKEHLPSDSIILLNLFATYMDTRTPPHPKCLTGRVFSQLNVVRLPDKPDLKSRHNCQFYQVSVQPPQFKVVLNGRIYAFVTGQKNIYHAILMFFHYYATTNAKFRSVSLGPSGLNVAWIFSKN